MGIYIVVLTLVLAWVFALLGLSAPGQPVDASFAISALHWMFYIPAGWMFIVSGVMHTVFAKSTAKNIGWKTNGFQYELGFASLGLGIAGIIAAYKGSGSWLELSIVITAFLVLAGINHLVEMFKNKNFTPGNTIILIYDFGLPASLWALLYVAGLVKF
jgi:uncharacterized membrane protein HdeD (DUF308 family)